MELLECRLQRQFIAYSRKLGWWFVGLMNELPFWREQSMKTRNQQQISPISSSRSNRQSGQSIRNNPHFINEIINQLLTPAIWFLIELLNAGLNFKIDLSQIVWALATFELAAQLINEFRFRFIPAIPRAKPPLLELKPEFMINGSHWFNPP